MELSLLTGVKIFLTIFDDQAPPVGVGADGSNGGGDPTPTGAKLIQY